MSRSNHAARLTAFTAAALVIAGCSSENSKSADETTEAETHDAATRGSYDFDATTGETRASYTDDEGTTTTMRSGEKVPVSLPAGFAVYPGAKVTNNTRVEQADGLLVLLNLESEATPGEMVAFYRKQAEEAGIDVETALTTGPMTMIGGEDGDGTSFSFTATRNGEATEAQLSLGRGLE